MVNTYNHSEKKFYHLIYLSQPTDDLNKDNLVEMLINAQKYNIDNQISGILIIKDKSIFQLLEGNQEKVTDLYNKIKKDSRHKTPLVIFEGFSAKRSIPFPGMALTLDQTDDHLKKNHSFYFEKSEAIKFTALISGKVKELLLTYLE